MESYEKLGTNLDGTCATNVIKLLMNLQNDNHQNNLFYDKSGNCPVCEHEHEEHLHFIWCQDPVLQKLNTKAVDKLLQSLKVTSTAGLLARVLKEDIQALREGEKACCT